MPGGPVQSWKPVEPPVLEHVEKPQPGVSDLELVELSTGSAGQDVEPERDDACCAVCS